MRPSATLHCVVGEFGEAALIKGWHERERDGRSGIAFRAARAEAFIRLKRADGARQLSVIVSGMVSCLDEKMTGEIVINGNFYPISLGSELWVCRSFPLNQEMTKQIEIKLIAHTSVIPAKVLNNGDAREIGWKLSAIWQE